MTKSSFLYESFLFLIIILKIVYISISFMDIESKQFKWNPNTINLLDKFQTAIYYVEDFFIYILILIIFTPFSSRKITINVTESHLLFTYAILGFIQNSSQIWLYYKNK